MTKQEQNERLNAAFSEQQNLLNKLVETDYIEHKVVDAICGWAKSERPTVAALVSAILEIVGEEGQYTGFPESKEAIREQVNSVEGEICLLNAAEVEEEVDN